jgi:HSP20 family protein
MTLVRWDPFREMAALSERLNRVLSDNPTLARSGETYGAWMPPVDIFEREDGLVLRAELPGMSRGDIDVSVENGLLTLQGERRREQGFDEESAHRLERVYGRFTRSFTLPTTVDASKIAATYKDGVLEIVLPKSEASKPKKVQIEAA